MLPTNCAEASQGSSSDIWTKLAMLLLDSLFLYSQKWNKCGSYDPLALLLYTGKMTCQASAQAQMDLCRKGKKNKKGRGKSPITSFQTNYMLRYIHSCSCVSLSIQGEIVGYASVVKINIQSWSIRDSSEIRSMALMS